MVVKHLEWPLTQNSKWMLAVCRDAEKGHEAKMQGRGRVGSHCLERVVRLGWVCEGNTAVGGETGGILKHSRAITDAGITGRAGKICEQGRRESHTSPPTSHHSDVPLVQTYHRLHNPS